MNELKWCSYILPSRHSLPLTSLSEVWGLHVGQCSKHKKEIRSLLTGVTIPDCSYFVTRYVRGVSDPLIASDTIVLHGQRE